MDNNRVAAFVVSHLNVDGELPIEIIPGHDFRAATENEVNEIRAHINQSTPFNRWTWVEYEGIVSEEILPNGINYNVEKLPPEAWKYWVIESYRNHETATINKIGRLLAPEIEIGFELILGCDNNPPTASVFSIMRSHIIDRFADHEKTVKNAEFISLDEILKIGKYHHAYENLSSEYSFCKLAIDNFQEIRTLPQRSELVVAGLFSIIETLITHKPRKSETLDSIIHQICNKMILIRKRYEYEINTCDYFDPVDEIRLWKKLYEYRSGIVHGTFDGFGNELQALKDRDTVVEFLNSNIRELIKIGLTESEFLSDLKKC